MNCDGCTTTNPQEAAFCTGCGKRLSPEATGKTTVATPAPDHLLGISVWLGISVLVVGGLVGTYMWRQDVAAREQHVGNAGSIALSPPPVSPQPAASPRHPNFGGGFHNTKWGMSPQDVRPAVGMDPSDAADNHGRAKDAPYNWLKYGDSPLEASVRELRGGPPARPETTYSFYHQALYRVEYSPVLSLKEFDHGQDFALALKEMISKYGSPEEHEGERDWWLAIAPGGENSRIKLYRWSDGETEINVELTLRGDGTVWGFKVIYESVGLRDRERADAARERAEREKPGRDEKTRAFARDL